MLKYTKSMKILSLRRIRKAIRKIVRVFIIGMIFFSIHILAENIFQFELPPFVIDFIQQPFLPSQKEEITLATFKPIIHITQPFSTSGTSRKPALVNMSSLKNDSRKFVLKNISSRKSYERNFNYPLDIDLEKMVKDKIHTDVSIPADPINPHPYKYIHSPTECQLTGTPKNPAVLILVKSAAQNKILRQGIRRSWANITLPNIKVVFLLAELKSQQKSVDREMKEHGDIVQENFKEAYHNNTLKSIMGYNWAISHCPGADFLFFVDDDYLVVINNILSYIRSLDYKIINNLYVGFLVPRSKPFSDLNSKWYVSVEEYPFDVWPPYLAGGAYLVSRQVAQRFQLAFPYVKYLRIDDSYIGIVARKLSIVPRPLTTILQQKRTVLRQVPPRFLAAHGFNDPSDMIRTHRQLQDVAKRHQATKTTKRSMQV